MKFLASWIQLSPIRSIALRGIAMPIAILVLTTGCQTSLLRDANPEAQADRLQATYPDLASGRFAVVADLENVAHAEVFRMLTPSRRGRVQVESGRGVPETGDRGLVVLLGGPEDALIASNADVTNWFLKRDWREYDLLMMQVYAPEPGAEVEIEIAAESGGRRDAVQAVLPLRPKWNLVRLDLGEVGEHLPMDDISEIRWRTPYATAPVELVLDDIVLANNSADLFGNSDGAEGNLYVRRRGRRWAAGAVGRFELGFGGGQIVQWFDLAGDPNRLNNLVAGTVLGPSPVVMPADEFAPPETAQGDFVELGETVIARQRVTEASPVRLVVETEWRFAGPTWTGRPEDQPYQRWTYTIYPSGGVYCHVECTTHHGDWRPEDIGLAVSRADPGGLEFYGHPPAQLRDIGRLRHLAYATIATTNPGGPGLLFTMHDARRAPEMEFFRELDANRVTLVASGGRVNYDRDGWMALLCIWPTEQIAGTHPANRALDYCYPVNRLRVIEGRLVRDDPGDENSDGYNERYGCYVVSAEQRRVRVEMDGSELPLYYPAFTVRGSADLDGWAYLNSESLTLTGHDASGDLLLQVPDVVTDHAVLEVYFSPAQGDRRAQSPLDTRQLQ